MGLVARSGRNKLWFGTEQRMGWFPTPLRGAGASNVGWESGGTLVNGGGYQFSSYGSHKEFVFEWPESSALEASSLLGAYASGSYGRGLIYFHDPLSYSFNVLPSQWADPSVGVGFEGASLVYGVYPSGVDTASRDVNDLPVMSASFPLSGVDVGWRGKEDALFVPIPEGYALVLGAFYSFTGSGGVFYRSQTVDGDLGSVTKLDPLSNGSSEVTNTVISGTGLAGVWLWVGRSANNSSSVTVSGMVGRLVEDRNLTSSVQVVNEFTYPSFEVGAGPVTVATNQYPNPDLVWDGAVSPLPGHGMEEIPGGGVSISVGGVAIVAPDFPLNSQYRFDGSGQIAISKVGEIYSEFLNPLLLPDGSGGVDQVSGGESWDDSGGLFVPSGEVATISLPGAFRSIVIVAGEEGQTVNGVTYDTTDIRFDSSDPILELGEGIWFRVGVYPEGYTGDVYDGSEGLVYMEPNLPKFEGGDHYVAVVPPVGPVAVPVTLIEGLIVEGSEFPSTDILLLAGEWHRIGVYPEGYTGDLFSGSSAPTADYTFSWTGAENDSESIQIAESLPGITNGHRSSEWAYEGTHSLRLLDEETIPVSDPSTVVVVARNSGQSLSSAEGEVTSSGTDQILRINATTNFTLSAGWWDLLTIVDGYDYVGDPFSGDSGTFFGGTESLKPDWSGTPHASTTEAVNKTPQLDKAKLGPWTPGLGHTGVRMVGHPTRNLTSPLGGGKAGFAATFREVGHWLHG